MALNAAQCTEDYIDDLIADGLIDPDADGQEEVTALLRQNLGLLVARIFSHIQANAVITVTVPQGIDVENLADPPAPIGQTSETAQAVGGIE